MRICQDCLLDCHGAATSSGRFDALHHLEGGDRKTAFQDLKDKEGKLAGIVMIIARERVRRRVKEWAVRSLRNQRLGLRTEQEAKELAEVAVENERVRIKKQDDFNQLMVNAGKVDQKWREENQNREKKDLKTRVHTANLNYQLEYTRDNPAPIAREHAHSWNHAHYLPDGTPVSPTGALERFGAFDIEPKTELQQLKAWKQHTIESHTDHLRRVDDYNTRQRDAELEEFGRRKEYVDKRLKRLSRNKELLERTLELEEQARLDKRKADRAARAAIRFAKMEAQERCSMEIEDGISGRYRFYEWEYLQIAREREGMWFEENEQRGVDNFWGLEVEARRLSDIRQKYVDFYDGRTSKLREQLIYTKQLRPFKIEAVRKEYKNPFTGEFLK
jgi:hypothetical protein